eukprot:1867141-Rhodomonas_salina.1
MRNDWGVILVTTCRYVKVETGRSSKKGRGSEVGTGSSTILKSNCCKRQQRTVTSFISISARFCPRPDSDHSCIRTPRHNSHCPSKGHCPESMAGLLA